MEDRFAKKHLVVSEPHPRGAVIGRTRRNRQTGEKGGGKIPEHLKIKARADDGPSTPVAENGHTAISAASRIRDAVYRGERREAPVLGPRLRRLNPLKIIDRFLDP